VADKKAASIKKPLSFDIYHKKYKIHYIRKVTGAQKPDSSCDTDPFSSTKLPGLMSMWMIYVFLAVRKRCYLKDPPSLMCLICVFGNKKKLLPVRPAFADVFDMCFGELQKVVT
jgi:hypothetical protein